MKKILGACAILALAVGSNGPLAGQFPGGNNGPLPMPGQVGLPVPFPGGSRVPGGTPPTSAPDRRPDAGADADKDRQLGITLGTLRQLTDDSVVVEAAESRIVTFQVTSDTRFLRAGDAIDPSILRPGDRLEVEATRDDESYLYAVNVTLEREGTAEERQAASEPVQTSSKAPSSDRDDDRPVLRRNEDRAQSARRGEDGPPILRRAGSASREESVTEEDRADDGQSSRAAERDADRNPSQAREPLGPAGPLEVPEPAPADPDDPGRPVLSRGGRAERVPPAEVAVNREPASPPPAREPAEPGPARASEPSAPSTAAGAPAPNGDSLIAMAQRYAAQFTQSLPNYLCQEVMTRFYNTGRGIDWRALDVVTAQIVFEDGSETYRNIEIDGKPTDKSMEELPGAWSTGEFGSVLAEIFHPGTAADFRRRGASRASGRNAEKYDFTVAQDRSNWTIQAPSQLVRPGYRGSVWIEEETGGVLRIEMQAAGIPRDFPLDNVQSAVDYEYIRIGDGEFLVPVHAETLSCTRGTNNCSRNTIDFRNYQKYDSDISITFDN